MSTVHLVGNFKDCDSDERVMWSIYAVFSCDRLKDAIESCKKQEDFIMVDFPINARWPDPACSIKVFHNTVYPVIDFPNMDAETIMAVFENRSDQNMTLREFADQWGTAYCHVPYKGPNSTSGGT